MPMIAFIGVRSSCDMLARKLDLVWLAASAASRACCSVDLGLLARGDVLDHRAELRLGLPLERDHADAGFERRAVEAAEAPFVGLHALARICMCRRISSSTHSRLVRPSAWRSGDSGGYHGMRPTSDARSSAPKSLTAAELQCVDAALAVEQEVAVRRVFEHRLEARLRFLAGCLQLRVRGRQRVRDALAARCMRASSTEVNRVSASMVTEASATSRRQAWPPSASALRQTVPAGKFAAAMPV